MSKCLLGLDDNYKERPLGGYVSGTTETKNFKAIWKILLRKNTLFFEKHFLLY